MQRVVDLFKENKGLLYGFAFLLPFAIYGVILILLGVHPFGEKSILVTDMHSQYVQFYTYLYDVLKNGKSIFYSWEAGMGLNFFGVFAYYLASPLSLLIILFDRNQLPEAMAVLTLLKVGLAGLSMAYFLSRVFNHRAISVLFFSTFYALMSFVTVYAFCVMWLDGIYLLPLILLGVERLLMSNRFILLTFSLAVMFMANFYIAYMVGIFTFIYFVARYIVIHDMRNLKLVLQKLIWFGISTALAAGMSAIVTLPTYLDLKSNFAERAKLPLTTEFNFDLLTFYSRFFSGVIDTTIDGMPNVYAGVLTLLLIPIFFVAKKISLKEKIVYGSVAAFLLVSFEIPFLNIAWHGFEPPTNFPYRYSFVFSFLLLYMAFRVYLIFDEELLPMLRKVVLFNVFMIFLLSKIAHYYMPANKVIINIFLVVSYAMLLSLKARKPSKKAFASLALAALISLDAAINTVYMIKLMGYEYGYINRQDYAVVHPNYQEAFNEIQSRDKGLYRVETTLESTWNDAMRFGYKGITHFNSVANGHLNLYMQDLGYGYLEALILQNGKGIVSTDALFGVKYMLAGAPLNKYGFEQIDQFGKIRLYENKNALPFGFMMQREAFETKGKEKLSVQKVNYTNAFHAQNKLIGPLKGETETTYYNLLQPVSVTYDNLDVLPKENYKTKIKNPDAMQNPIYLAKQQERKPASIKYVFDVKGKQQLYMQMRVEPTEYTKVYVNGKSLGEKFAKYPRYYWNNGILDLGYFNDEKVEVEVKVLRNAIDIHQSLVYGLNIPVFEKRIQQLREQSLQVTSYDGRSLQGMINVKQDDMLFLSIPYDKGWKATVDGKEAKLLKLNDAFLGMEVEEGKHSIELTYTSPGFRTGAMISIASLLVTLMAIYFAKKKRN
ncbi:MAG: YfhO family protein [Ectobacillus sp.]